MKGISPLFAIATLSLFFVISCGTPNKPTKEVYITYSVRRLVAESRNLRRPSEKKMQSAVLELYYQYQANGGSFDIPKSAAEKDPLIQPSIAKVNINDEVFMYIYMNPKDTATRILINAFRSELSAKHVRFTDSPMDTGFRLSPNDTSYIWRSSGTLAKPIPFVQGWVPVASIDSIAQIPEVYHLAFVTEPFMAAGPDFKGSVYSRADVSQKIWNPTLVAGSSLSADGTGIKVGVISDDCGSKTEPGTSNCPLNNAINANNWLQESQLGGVSRGNIIDDNWNGERSHEGLAMMEAIHDIAPKAEIAFASGFGTLDALGNNLGLVSFLHAIDTLAYRNCSVITDDIQYMEEPAFEDGPIAQRIDVLANDPVYPIIYTAAAGNWAQKVYSFTFDSLAIQPVGIGYVWESHTIHNRNNKDYPDSFMIRPSKNLDVMLQWDDPYMHPIDTANDFDLLLVDVATNQIVTWSTNFQNGYDSVSDNIPFEHLTYVQNECYGSKGYKLFITRNGMCSANPTPRMKLLIQGIWDEDNWQVHPSQEKSLFGHAAARGCIACGALNPWGDYNVPEFFSSKGSVEIVQTNVSAKIDGKYFHRPLENNDSSGRIKPDLMAIDQISTSVHTMERFSGSSASAPSVAGLAAIMLGLKPVINSTNVKIGRAMIEKGCMHYGDDARKNNVFGMGRIDAFRSIAFALQNADADKNFASFMTSVISDHEGSVQIGNAFGSFSGSQNFFISATIEGTIDASTSFMLQKQDLTTAPLQILGSYQHGNVILGRTGSPFPTAPSDMPLFGFYGNSVSLPGQTGDVHLIIRNTAGSSAKLKDWGIYVRK